MNAPILGSVQRTLSALGLDKRRRSDRRLLERVIFPWLLAQPQWQRVLFVGCAWYTQRYHALFAAKDYWTLEPDPDAARYGAARHVTARLQDMADHFADGSIDVVVCNGVLGWGLDDPQSVQSAFVACHRALRGGGLLLVGWNDLPAQRARERMLVPALLRFQPFVCPALGAAVMRTSTFNRHTYSFFLKLHDFADVGSH